MQKIMNGFYNVKYKLKNLEEAIKYKCYEEEFKDELYDLDIAFQYVDEMIKEYKNKEKKKLKDTV